MAATDATVITVNGKQEYIRNFSTKLIAIKQATISTRANSFIILVLFITILNKIQIKVPITIFINTLQELTKQSIHKTHKHIFTYIPFFHSLIYLFIFPLVLYAKLKIMININIFIIHTLVSIIIYIFLLSKNEYITS